MRRSTVVIVGCWLCSLVAAAAAIILDGSSWQLAVAIFGAVLATVAVVIRVVIT